MDLDEGTTDGKPQSPGTFFNFSPTGDLQSSESPGTFFNFSPTNELQSSGTSLDFSRGRACLVLSLIVLVWNLGLTARDAFFLPGRDAAGEPAAASDATGGRPGALSVRQRFLLGRAVDVNSAGWEEISGLPGISDAVARAFVERRRRSGPFGRPQDLLDVPGIKARRLKKILPFLSGFPNN